MMARSPALCIAVVVVLLVVGRVKMEEFQQQQQQPLLMRNRRWSSFYRDFYNLWGGQHQRVSGNGNGEEVSIWLDSSSGSGFKSRRSFRSGYFGASIKLQRGYTAGVITAFYLSNSEAHPGFHDEVDMEFLGTTPGKPYTLQTNVYVRGSGDGGPGRVVVGREVKFHLDWFDPTADFHHYAILWTPTQIIFYVDDVPIRRYPRRRSNKLLFPERAMWVYGSIWDASSWATDDGRYKADYRYSPFVAHFAGFQLRAPPPCHSLLTPQQKAAMRWVQRNHMVYNYCFDPKRNHALTPECSSSSHHHAHDLVPVSTVAAVPGKE